MRGKLTRTARGRQPPPRAGGGRQTVLRFFHPTRQWEGEEGVGGGGGRVPFLAQAEKAVCLDI